MNDSTTEVLSEEQLSLLKQRELEQAVPQPEQPMNQQPENAGQSPL